MKNDRLLWGGRFAGPMAEELRRFTTSLPVDVRLLPYDVRASLAHLETLAGAGVVDHQATGRIRAGLETVLREWEEGTFPPDGCEDEDIHSAVEARLRELVGSDAGRLRAGRSRNDQVVTDVLLWLRDSLADLENAAAELQRALVDQGRACKEMLVPGHTHLQQAQPVLLAHLLLSHVEALGRDRERIRDARRRADRCPLGSAAMAGTSFPLDREAAARLLGFSRPAPNAADAVSDRDWAVEAVSACALLQVHLSRLAEDLVLWSSQEFGWARMGEAWCTGSSIMPQKRNPDVAELVRGKAGRVIADLVALLTLLKGLPSTYGRDLQEDKEALFDAVDTASASCRVLAGTVASTEFDAERAGAGLLRSASGATDLADLLVGAGVPFAEAHGAVGVLVARCEEMGVALMDAPEVAAREVLPVLPEGWRRVLDPRGSVEAKATSGSTSPAEVERALARWEAALGTGPS